MPNVKVSISLIFFAFFHIILMLIKHTGDELVSTGKDELVRQPIGDVITATINGKTYHINRAPALMACAAC